MQSAMILLIFLIFIVNDSLLQQACATYTPTWQSLDSRPLPQWYDDAKVGIFIHWGVFSVPSYRSEWFWWDWKGVKYKDVVDFMSKNYPPSYTYADFASSFHAEFYDPDYWVNIFKDAGAKYVVLTSKHHEGFTNWPSKYSFNWNSGAVGPKMDLVGKLANSTKTAGLHFGLYHSLFEWFNPLYLQDKESNWETTKFVDDKTMPELFEIVNKYEPELIWSDGDWVAPDSYWKSRDFLAWLYNDSPVKDRVVVNDRWGQGAMCHHGGYYTCSDRYSPGHLVKHKWENAMTLDRQSWGFRRNATANDYLTIGEVISLLASTVSCGGNLLINVGPTADGRIPPIMEERLRELGAWLRTNGQAVYSSKPWTYQNDTQTKDIWYTKDDSSVYAIFLKWPANGQLFIAAPVLSSDASIKLLGADTVQFDRVQPSGVKVQLPALVPSSQIAGFSGWVLQLVGVTN